MLKHLFAVDLDYFSIMQYFVTPKTHTINTKDIRPKIFILKKFSIVKSNQIYQFKYNKY